MCIHYINTCAISYFPFQFDLKMKCFFKLQYTVCKLSVSGSLYKEYFYCGLAELGEL